MKNFLQSNYALILILAVAALLRFYQIDYQSLWLDEICSMIEANPSVPWKDLEISIINSDPHPQLYFVFLKAMLQALGYTSFVGRILSAITGILGVYALYLLGKELINKKVGLIAAFLLAINFFHIYYSQEVRMYAQLLFFTVVSFYFLVRFLKDKTWKNTIWYGIFTGCMLLTQFFGLFVLMSQLFILLFVFLKLPKTEKLPFVYKSAVSGAIMAVLFLPALNIFIATTKKKYAVMQPVSVDLIKQIFMDFAEKSDLILWMAILSIAAYFVLSIRQKAFGKKEESLAMLILGSWILITLAIPIIRSILVTPMIVSRYFIVILPAILLLVAMGLNKLPKKLASVSVALFAVAAFYVSVYKDNYYVNVNKTQFREVAAFVNSHNADNDPLITNLPWHTTFFFKTETVDTPITEKSFDGYVQELMKDSRLVEPFWYFGAFGTPVFLSDESKTFLDKNFILKENFVGYDSWARHYIPKNVADSNIVLDSTKTIVLSNLNDEFWIGGVSTKFAMLLVDYSDPTMENLKNAKHINVPGAKNYRITKVEKMGDYIHINLDRTPFPDRELLKHPTSIGFN